MMTTASAQNLKYPFMYAITELLEVGEGPQRQKKQFVESAVRVLSKGFNTDTNCSIVLGLVGAIIGYDHIPAFFRNKILNSSPLPSRQRKKNYHTRKVVEIVEGLLTHKAEEGSHFAF
jgi:hypothetical protein